MAVWTNPQARDLVIRTLLGESNKTPEGMISVAHVIKTRADSGAWGDPTKGGLTRAITAPKQFSMWNTDNPKLLALAASSKAVPTDSPLYQRAAAIVDGVFGNDIPDPTGGATNYHTPDVHPDWSQGQTPVAMIGGHYFYKLPFTAATTGGTAVTSPSMVGVGGSAAPAPAPGFVYGGASPQDPGVDTRHLEPVFKARIDKLQADAAAAGIKTHLTDGYRDNTSQAADYAKLGAQGLAAAPGSSYHQFGRAVDLVADNPAQQQALIALADQPGRGITAGAHFATPDRVHFQAAEGKTAPLLEAGANAPAKPIGQGGIGSDASAPLGTASPGPPAVSTIVPSPNVPAANAQPVSATAPANSSAGFVGPGSDKVSLVKSITSGTSHNPQITTAANWGNLFGGAPPVAPPAAPAAAPLPVPRPASDRQPSTREIPAPTPPPGAPVNEPPSSPMASIVTNWGATTPTDSSTIPDVTKYALPGSGVTGRPAMTEGAPSMGFPAMTNPFGQPPPDQQTSMLPGSMLASAQNLMKLLFPTA
jgi:hypothetical protein